MDKLIMTPQEVLTIYRKEGEFPIDPEKIAKRAEFVIKAIEEPGLSGKLELRDNQPPIIYVNRRDPVTRQRFTVAHELGHYFCGHGSNPREDPAFNLKPIVFNKEERQANSWASNLLMPKDFVEYFLIKKNISDIAVLAEEFNVSQVAMQFRLKNLGWL